MQCTYTPAMLSSVDIERNGSEIDDLIAFYYHAGYTIREIIGFLALCLSVAVSKRQVHSILRRMSLYRRNNQSSLEEIVQAILQELSGTGRNIGYRAIRRRLLVEDHGIVASFELLRLAMSVLDADSLLSRRRHRIRRHTFYNKGPNYAIHIDGRDKLKPYGVSVHGAIAGFSKRVLWLKACDSNKKFKYILARFYLNYVEEIGGVPMLICADRSTENSSVRTLRYSLR